MSCSCHMVRCSQFNLGNVSSTVVTWWTDSWWTRLSKSLTLTFKHNKSLFQAHCLKSCETEAPHFSSLWPSWTHSCQQQQISKPSTTNQIWLNSSKLTSFSSPYPSLIISPILVRNMMILAAKLRPKQHITAHTFIKKSLCIFWLFCCCYCLQTGHAVSTRFQLSYNGSWRELPCKTSTVNI